MRALPCHGKKTYSKTSNSIFLPLKFQPLTYWIHFLNREFEGSLYSVLKKKGLIYYLIATNERPARGFDFFSINVEMTIDGLYQIDEIMALIFQYIERLRETGPIESIFNVRISEDFSNFDIFKYFISLTGTKRNRLQEFSFPE